MKICYPSTANSHAHNIISFRPPRDPSLGWALPVLDLLLSRVPRHSDIKTGVEIKTDFIPCQCSNCQQPVTVSFLPWGPSNI